MTHEERRAFRGHELDPRRIEVMDDAMANMLRQKNGAERLEIASNMYEMVRQMLMTYFRSQHPEWSDAEVTLQTARRMSHGAV